MKYLLLAVLLAVIAGITGCSGQQDGMGERPEGNRSTYPVFTYPLHPSEYNSGFRYAVPGAVYVTNPPQYEVTE